MRRLLIAAAIGVLVTATGASASDQATLTVAQPVAVTAAAVAPRIDVAASPVVTKRSFTARRRPLVLPALYGASVALQGYDAYSTLSAIKHGGVEANPFMKGLTKSPAAFIGLKAGVTMLSILAAERMWKNQNRVGAIATMLVTNGLMTAVAANNARVLSRVR